MHHPRVSRPGSAASLVVALLWLVSLLAACAPSTAAPSATASPPTATGAPLATESPSSVATPTGAPAPTDTPPPSPATVATSTAAPPPTPTTTQFPLTVTDDAGRKVTFDHAPRRIISLSPGHTETLYALGLGGRIVATDSYSDYPAENKPKATLKTYPKPPVEQIVADKPDLVLSLVEGDDFFQQMDAQGIKALKLFPTTYDGTLRDINLIGQVTGTADRAAQITTDMRRRANAVVAKTKDAPKPVVVYELDASDPTKPFVAGPRGFYGDLIPMAGGKNAFDDLKTDAAQVSAEQVIARDPDVIILGDSMVPFNPQTAQTVKARPGWSQIKAVKNNRILLIDDALLSRPGPRLVDGLEQLAKGLHPELFS